MKYSGIESSHMILSKLRFLWVSMNENLNYSTTFSDYFAYRNKLNISSCLDAATRSQKESQRSGKNDLLICI
jgi:hypothetical protein